MHRLRLAAAAVAALLGVLTWMSVAGPAAHAVGPVTVTAPSAISGPVGTSTPVTGASVSGFLVADTVRLLVSVTSGSLEFTASTGVSVPTGYPTLGAAAGTLAIEGTQADINTTLDSLTWTASSTGAATLTLSAVLGNAIYDPTTGHYYQVVDNGSAITWNNAVTAAAVLTFNGYTGYLATVTSAAENTFLAATTGQQAWIGASDAGSIGTYSWRTGPETGQVFWTTSCGQGLQGVCTDSGSAAFGRYANWNSGEPNHFGGNEYYAEFNAPIGSGRWNDLPDASSPQRYLVEFGGAGGSAASEGSATQILTGITTPGAPTGVTAVAGSGEADVQWSAPDSDGLSTITEYSVQARVDGHPTGVPVTLAGSPPSTTARVRGLAVGTPYTFTVAATNAAGTGPDSAASNAVTPVAVRRPSATVLDISPAAPPHGSALVLTATVTGPAHGTVVFSEGSTTLGQTTLSAGRATLTVAHLAAESHTITASYLGSGTYLPSSASATYTIGKADATLALAASPRRPHTGQDVTLTATVKAAEEGTPTGTVTFADGQARLGSAPLTSGVAVLVVPAIGIGDHALTATYSGDTAFNQAATVDAVEFSVGKVATTTLLEADPARVTYPARVTVTAIVRPAEDRDEPIGGTVTFSAPGQVWDPVPVTGGRAQLTVARGLHAGRHTLQARYSGDDAYLPSSASTVVVVEPATTSMSAGASAAEVAFATEVTYRASVDSSTETASGTVQFSSSAGTLCSATLEAGRASCHSSGAPLGAVTVTAGYEPDPDFAPAHATVALQITLPTEATGDAHLLNLELSAPAGTPVAKGRISIRARGLRAESPVAVGVRSAPVVLTTSTAHGDGTFSAAVTLPSTLETGPHHVIVTGIAADGAPVVGSLPFGVDEDGLLAAAAPDSTPASTPAAIASPASTPAPEATPSPASTPPTGAAPEATPTNRPATQAARQPGEKSGEQSGGRASYRAYDVLNHPKENLSVQVGALALLGGLGAAAGGSRTSGSRKRGSSKITSAKVTNYKNRWEGEAPGDHSRTWRWPGTARLDSLGHSLPVRLAPISPLGARLLKDGAYLRAMLGSGYLLLPPVAVIVALFGVLDVQGAAVPPAIGITLALVIVGVIDAACGLLATVVFISGVALHGGLDSADAVRTVMGLGVLWFAAPLIASAARPFRRPPARDLEERWDRGADLVIAALIGAWAAQKMVKALPGLSGLDLPIAAWAGRIGLLVLGLIVLRMLVESLASVLYPARLAAVEPERLPWSSRHQRIASTLLRTGLFVFASIVFVGNCWQLYTGAAMALGTGLLSIYENSFPNYPSLFRLIPAKTLKIVIMMVVGTLWARFVFSHLNDPARVIANSFLLLSVPGLIFSLIELFGRDGEPWPMTWPVRFTGAGVVGLGVLLALGIVTIG